MTTSAMTLESWYYISAIASFFVALGGLIGLIVYAVDTRRLRIIAQAQLEATIRPCVLLMEDADKLRNFKDANLILKNVGVGAALNVHWRYKKKRNSGWIGCPALEPGGFIRPPVRPQDVLDGSGVECEFSSLSDTTYRVTTTCGAPGSSLEMRHQIEVLKS